MGKRQGQNSHRRVHRHHVTVLYSPSFPLPSFHPSLPHIYDPVINLVEISHLLINTCPPLVSLSPSLLILSDSGFLFFFFPSVLSVAHADENGVMCRARGVREEDWAAAPSS